MAQNGPDALEEVERGCPDIAILDIGLPGMTGYELATKLKASSNCLPSMKLVALTGYAEDPEALAAATFDGHMNKPVNVPQLELMLAVFSR